MAHVGTGVQELRVDWDVQVPDWSPDMIQWSGIQQESATAWIA